MLQPSQREKCSAEPLRETDEPTTTHAGCLDGLVMLLCRVFNPLKFHSNCGGRSSSSDGPPTASGGRFAVVGGFRFSALSLCFILCCFFSVCDSAEAAVCPGWGRGGTLFRSRHAYVVATLNPIFGDLEFSMSLQNFPQHSRTKDMVMLDTTSLPTGDSS